MSKGPYFVSQAQPRLHPGVSQEPTVRNSDEAPSGQSAQTDVLRFDLPAMYEDPWDPPSGLVRRGHKK